MLHHPFKNNPLSRCTQLCCSTKVTASSSLPVTRTKGPLLKSHSLTELLVLVLQGRKLWSDRGALMWWGYGREGKGGQVPAHGLPPTPRAAAESLPQRMLRLSLTRAATREEYLQRKGMGKSHKRGHLPQKMKRKLWNPKGVSEPQVSVWCLKSWVEAVAV